MGRVHPDIRDKLIIDIDFILSSIFWVEASVIVIIIILSILHYAAVLFYLIDIPIWILLQYILDELKRNNLEKEEFVYKYPKMTTQLD